MEVSDALVISERPRKTRAEILRERVVIRLALDETGPTISEILKANGIELPGANWSKVFPHWLIACDRDDVIGCVIVLPAKPVGYAEFLFVKPSISFKLRALAIRKLIIAAMATIQAGGAAYVGAVLDAKNDKFMGVLTKLNFVRASNNTMMVKIIA